jgi:phosphatidylinositol alpha-1,6-mannosyltransferase
LKKVFALKLATLVHGNDVLRPQRHIVTRWMLIRGLAASDLVIANSAFTAGELRDLGVEPGKIKVINPSAETGKFHPHVEFDTVRQRHRLERRRVLLVVSRLYRGRKGIETILKALAALRGDMPDMSLVIVGTGPAREELEEMAAAMGLAHAVIFTGYVADDELPAYYCASDIFVMVSDFDRATGDVEGYGIVYDEAHLCGKPCIAADIGGAPEAVHNEFDGLLVPPGDSAALAAAIRRLAGDPGLARRFGMKGRDRILAKRYDWDALNRLGEAEETR